MFNSMHTYATYYDASTSLADGRSADMIDDSVHALMLMVMTKHWTEQLLCAYNMCTVL